MYNDPWIQNKSNQIKSSNLRSHGMEKFLQECLISFACDGAAVMLGRKTGVATEKRIPKFSSLALLQSSLRTGSQ
jgi:hypothetical protein